MKKGRVLWSAHRITEKQKVGKARNIKEKQLKNSRSTASKPLVAHLSSASDNRMLRLYQRIYKPQKLSVSGVFLMSKNWLDVAAGKGAGFEICDPALGVWVNDANIIWNEKKQDNGRWDPMPWFVVYSKWTVIYFWLRLFGLSGIVISNCPDSKSGLICFKVKFLKSLKPQNAVSSFFGFGVVQKSKICLDTVDSSESWLVTWWITWWMSPSKL